jgi:type I restriction enzyme M protein
MNSRTSTEDQLVSRSELASLAGVRRPAITNWESRHRSFPRPVRSGDTALFRLGEVLSWLEDRPIPSGSLRAGEAPGTTYAVRVRGNLPTLAESDAESAKVGLIGEGDPQALDALLGPLAGRVRGAGSAKDHLQLLMSLLFLRSGAPGFLSHLAQTRPATDDAAAACSWLVRIGDVVDRRLRDRGLLPGMKEVLAGLQPVSVDDVAQVICLCGQLGRDAFAQLLARYEAESSLKSDQFFTPDCVTQLVADLLLLGASPGQRLHDPYIRGGELLAAVAARAVDPVVVHGQSPDRESLRLAGMQLAVSGLHPRLEPVASSPWHPGTWPRHQADVIVTNPPFNGTSSSGPYRAAADWPFGPPPPGNDNFAWLQHAFASLADGGRAAVVMPNSAATSAHSRERVIRRAMVKNGAVECVLALPPQLFARTPIAVSVWILRKEKVPHGQVLLVNARGLGKVSRGRRVLLDEDRAAIVRAYRLFRQDIEGGLPHQGTNGLSFALDAAQIGEPDYSLNPMDHQIGRKPRLAASAAMAVAAKAINGLAQRRAAACAAADQAENQVTRRLAPGVDSTGLPPAWQRVRLSELCDIAAGPSPARLPPQQRTDDGTVLVLLKHLVHGRIDTAGDIRITRELAHKLSRFQVAPGDILCARSGTTGPSALVTAPQEGWVFGSNLLRLRQRAPGLVDPRYLLGYLSLPDVQEWIKGRSEGAAIPTINVESFGQLEVVLPSPAEQRRIGFALDALDGQAAAYRALLTAASEARDALAEHLLSGSVTLLPQIDQHTVEGVLP